MTTVIEQKHPFEVGKKYRNELGEYMVVELDWPDMVIQMEDGNEITSPIALQQRIWERLQEEKRTRKRRAAEKKAATRSTRSKNRSRYGKKFNGLTESDFGPSLAGTSWRRKEELGGLLARYTSERTDDLYDSSPVARRPQVHIVKPAYYRAKDKQHAAKFLFSLDSEEVFYGFYIEKSDKAMDETWDWPRFLKSFASDTQLQATATVAMQELELSWFYNLGHEESAGNRYRVVEDGVLQLMDGKEGKAVEWDDFISDLRELPEKTWCDLYLGKSISKQEAIELGVGIANAAASVYAALAPLYDASLNPALEAE